MYTVQIIWFLLLPLAIFLSYRLVLFALRKFQNKFPINEEKQEKE
jgi:hypothetical protein